MYKKWILNLTLLSFSGLFGAQAFLDRKRPASEDLETENFKKIKLNDLFNASMNNDLEAVVQLLAEGVSPNETKLTNLTGKNIACTPLYVACRQGHFEIARTLLEASANPNTQVLYTDNEINFSPLYITAQNNHPEIASLLLAYGADVNKGSTEPNGDAASPLYIAAQNNYPEMANLLLTHGASVNKTYKDSTHSPYLITKNQDIKRAIAQHKAIEEKTCPICIEAFSKEEPIVFLPCCNKPMHPNCYQYIPGAIKKCPLCRDNKHRPGLGDVFASPDIPNQLPIDL